MITGISLGHATTAEAEQWLRSFLDTFGEPADLIACTHVMREPHPHVALSLAAADLPAGALPATPPRYTEAGGRAAVAHAARRSGRAVRYPGVDTLIGRMTVAEVLALSAIEEVVLAGGARPTPETVVELGRRDRPEWRGGRLTLVAAPTRRPTGLTAVVG